MERITMDAETVAVPHMKENKNRFLWKPVAGRARQ